MIVLIAYCCFVKNIGGKGHNYLPNPPETLTDRALDIGTYHKVDEAGDLKFLTHKYDGRPFCHRQENQRRRDHWKKHGLNVSNKPVYVFRLDLDRNIHKVLGVVYTTASGTNFEKARNGIDMNFTKTIPPLTADFINDRGLYIETNIRPGETKERRTSTSSAPRTPIAVLTSAYRCFLYSTTRHPVR